MVKPVEIVFLLLVSLVSNLKASNCLSRHAFLAKAAEKSEAFLSWSFTLPARS